MGTILLPRSLRIKEQPIGGHCVFLVKVGAKREVWIRSPKKCPNYKR
jgi:hypothetical protein